MKSFKLELSSEAVQTIVNYSVIQSHFILQLQKVTIEVVDLNKVRISSGTENVAIESYYSFERAENLKIGDVLCISCDSLQGNKAILLGACKKYTNLRINNDGFFSTDTQLAEIKVTVRDCNDYELKLQRETKGYIEKASRNVPSGTMPILNLSRLSSLTKAVYGTRTKKNIPQLIKLTPSLDKNRAVYLEAQGYNKKEMHTGVIMPFISFRGEK